MNTKLWDRRYQELIEYKKVNGDTNVPRRYEANPQLGVWVSNQRQYFKKYKNGISGWGMTEDRARRLEAVGFEWVLTGGRTGNVMGGGGYVGFGSANDHESAFSFISGNSSNNHCTSTWTITPGMEWECMYDRLVSYKRIHGKLDPSLYSQDKKLTEWVEIQKQECSKYVKGIKGSDFLTLERFQLLVEIGLVADDELNEKEQREQHDSDSKDTDATKNNDGTNFDKDEVQNVKMLDQRTKTKVKEILLSRKRPSNYDHIKYILSRNDLDHPINETSISDQKYIHLRHDDALDDEYDNCNGSESLDNEEDDDEDNVIYFDAIAQCGKDATLDEIAEFVVRKFSDK